MRKVKSTKKPARPSSPGDGGYFVAWNPDAPASLEPAIWRPEIAPGTLIVALAPEGFDAGDALEPSTAGKLIADCNAGVDRHVIIADPEGEHHLWIHGVDAARRPALVLPLDAAFELRVMVMNRFYRRLRGRPAGPLPQTLQLTALRRARLILLLHALDFRLAGARPREIAAALIDAREASLPALEWKSSAARRRTNRMIADALALMNGEYRKLLRGG